MAKHKVLITVTTYPLPSNSYDELVCTAGVLENGNWIRIYPVPLQFLTGLRKDGKVESFKYNWLEIDLKRRTDDFRPESHSPVDYTFSDIIIHGKIGTESNWLVRKQYCLANVYTNLSKLLEDSKAPQNVSLATFRPAKIIGFEIENDVREWKKEWKEQLKQLQFAFEEPNKEQQAREVIKKLPYKFYYKFKDDEGTISRLMIEDWELGALYWNCLSMCEGDENKALLKVREKYEKEFITQKELYLFLGTTKEWHTRRSKNPFVIIGLFYPKKEIQSSLF